MRTLLARLAIASLLLAGCKSSDSLVVVGVTSATQLDGVARLHVVAAVAGSASSQFDIRPGGTFSIPPRKSFGIQLAPSYRGTIAVAVDALDASDKVLASGSQSTQIAAGHSSSLELMLGGTVADMGGGDAGSGPVLTISPTHFTFAEVAKGQAGQTATFTITNADVAMTPALPGASLNGAAAGSFVITSDGCAGMTLAPGASCPVAVQFKPAVGGKNVANVALASASAALQGYGIGTWTVEVQQPLDMMSPPAFTSVWSAPGASVWAVTDGGNASSVWRRDAAGTWTQPINNESGSLFFAVWGLADADLWVGGQSTLSNNTPLAYHHDANGKFNPQGAGISVSNYGSIRGLWGLATNDVWAAVDNGQGALHWNGNVWIAETTPAKALVSIWEDAASKDVFAVGYTVVAPTITQYFVHRTANSMWTSVAPGMLANGQTLYGVWGAAANDVYLVGYNGTLWHFDGSATLTAPTPSPPAVALRGIWGSAADDIYVVGDNGTILHSNGSNAWEAQTSNTTIQLNAVFGASATDVYAVGQGVILHYH